jgi:protein-tyrosine phosphatase
VNVRDLGGLPSRHGVTTQFGQVVRSDNLQDLTDADVELLVGKVGVTDVIDLRTSVEVASEGPGPLNGHADVNVHHHSLYPESGGLTDATAPDPTLPWMQSNSDGVQIWNSAGLYYTKYLYRRPDSLLAALRAMATSRGATIAHCAAGKDRTGVVCALALSVVDVEPDAIVADYVATAERMGQVLARLRATSTYADTLDDQALDKHLPRAEAMETFLSHLDSEHGGALGWLSGHGWTDADTTALRSRLLGTPRPE